MLRGEGLAAYCWVLSCLIRPSLEIYILMENWYGLESDRLNPVGTLVHLGDNRVWVGGWEGGRLVYSLQYTVCKPVLFLNICPWPGMFQNVLLACHKTSLGKLWNVLLPCTPGV
jgi:hypothetical protein